MNDGYDMAVFTEAIRLPREQRAAFLDKACGEDAELRREVEALIGAHERVGDFLEEPRTGGPNDIT